MGGLTDAERISADRFKYREMPRWIVLSFVLLWFLGTVALALTYIISLAEWAA